MVKTQFPSTFIRYEKFGKDILDNGPENKKACKQINRHIASANIQKFEHKNFSNYIL